MSRIIDETKIPDNDERLAYYINNPISSKIRQAGEKKAEKLSEITGLDYKQLRILAKNDVYFLGYTILGYNKLSANLHGHVSQWMMRNRYSRFRELLLPRGHLKSTLWTITDGIRIALPDDSDLNIWPECLGTNVRILIGHEVKDTAATFLVSIAGHFLSNPLLMALFPECIPSPRVQRINKYELELPRSELWNEATYVTMGVGGKSQGQHFNYLKLDDLIGDKARDSKAEMETAILWIDNIQSFFIEFTRDHLDITGTRWAPRDLYWHLHHQYGPSLLKYIRPAEELNEKTQQYEPIYPEGFTTESFALIKRNPIVWAAQYANNPEAYGRAFLSTWKRKYKWIKYLEKLVAYKGQSDVADLSEIHLVKDMDICILVDPAMTGHSGIIVTGGTGDKQFILEAIKYPLKPPEFVELLFTLVLKWKPRLVSIEEVLFSGLFRPWLHREMQARRIFFYIHPFKVGIKQKAARIRGLANYFAGGKIFFHDNQVDLVEEFDGFSSSMDDEATDMHLLDALSQGPELWMTRLASNIGNKLMESYRRAEEFFLEEQDAVTGY